MPFKRRHPALPFVLAVATLGIYAFYWYYRTCRELARRSGAQGNIILWATLLAFWPIPVCLYSFYRQGELLERVSPGTSRWRILALWVFFPPAAFWVVQSRLNEPAGPAPVPQIL